MTRTDLELSRRRLIALGGGAGLLGLASGAFAGVASGRVRHNRSYQVDGPGVDLRVNWAEWYNGTQLEDQGSAVDAGGPVLTLENVLPGDSGRLHFGLTVDAEGGGAQQAQLSMQFHAPESGYAENDRTEPERVAGDDSPDRGELQDYLQVHVWYDIGIVVEGVGLIGACDGNLDVGEPVIAQGSLAEVSDAIDGRIPLDARPNTPATDCLNRNEELCIGVDWELPADLPGVDDNVVQGDSVDVQLGFGAESCEGGGGPPAIR